MSRRPTASEIYDVYSTCPIQQGAYDMLALDVTAMKSYWCDDSDEIEIPKDHPHSSAVDRFVRAVLESLCVYGFVIYRAKLYESTNEDPVWSLEVGDVRLIGVTLSKGRLVPCVAGWRINILRMPQVHGPNWALGEDGRQVHGVQYRSFAAKAYDSSVMLDKLHRNYVARDTHNAEPTVYTGVSKTKAVGSFMPSLYSGIAGVGIGSSIGVDEQSNLAARQQAIQDLSAMSRQIRDSSAKGDGSSKKPAPTHKEHFVTDAMDYEQAVKLSVEGDMPTFTANLRESIHNAFTVFIQVSGHIASSERLSISSTVTHIPIRRYSIVVNEIFSHISAVVREVTHDIGDEDAYIAIRSIPNEMFTAQIEPYLDTPYLIDMYSDRYNIPKEMFRPEAISKKMKVATGEADNEETPLIPEE